ncbi:MAG TPA: ScyD/ScyE family protein [Gaiellales bacterium]|nr:ScyD/ScyE family protein [Gaiellales bacterium]
MRRWNLACALGVAAVAMLAVSATSVAARPHAHMTVIASGLDNPRDLAFGAGGRLFVAEAGHGGSRCIPGGEQGDTCIGFTSKIGIVNIAKHRVRTVIDGLVSLAGKDGSGATGVDGIDVLGRSSIYGIITGAPQFVPSSGFTPRFRAHVRSQLGRLIRGSVSGSWHTVADVGRRSFIWTSRHKNLVPGQYPDANPYGVYAASNSQQWVVDAGANTINRIDARGRVHVVQWLPNPPSSDAVPTCIDRGPDGALYIGQLTGGGNAPGAASVWRFAPWQRHHRLTKWATGLTAVTGCGFSRGRFYAVELSTLGLDNAAPNTGALVRVPPHSSHPVTVLGGLSFPGGFAAGSDGSLYFSNWSVAPASTGLGSVVRVTL